MRVSTIIPAFNAERTIADAIESALTQRYDDQEIVVVNDGSTDSTPRILSSYGNNIKVVNRENGGAAAARNTGVANSTGKYLAFLDSDDLWLPGKLATMVAVLERSSSASLAFSEYGLIDQQCTEYGKSGIGDVPSMAELMNQRPFPFASFGGFIYPSTWVVPRRVFESTGGFCEAFKGAGYEDSWMLLLLRDLGEFVYVPDKLTLYRVGYASAVADKYSAGMSIYIDLVRKRYGRQAEVIIRHVKTVHCRSLLSKTAHQMDRGDCRGAMDSLLQLAKFRPTYFLSAEFVGRLRLSQNTRRLREVATMLTRARG
jgi:glycosyltransferase involved in cell wall biosynthesis